MGSAQYVLLRNRRPNGSAMLRLTRVMHVNSGVTLMVEGRIVAEWGELLSRECAALIDGGSAVCLDLSGVTYVDARGAELLRQLGPRGVRLLRTPRLLADQLNEDGHD
jgi:hypothetical protein